MNRLFHTCKQLIGIAALSVGLYACDWIHDDSLPLCEFRLYFKYDYNMKFADAFQHITCPGNAPGIWSIVSPT